MNQAIVEKTRKAIQSISTMDCIKPYYLADSINPYNLS